MFKRIVVKVGSNVLAAEQGGLNATRIESLCRQIQQLHEKQIEVILISSGAVAAGKGIVQLSDRFDTVAARQVWAAVGQVKLIESYVKAFEPLNIQCAQVLVTKEDFRDRTHYLNLRNCFHALLSAGIVPVVNENDAISVTELMFTDNDELSGLIATMLNADALVILSNVDGIFDKSPSDPTAQLIETIAPDAADLSKFISTTKSNFGRGGMITKSNMAKKVARSGIHVFIANGTIDRVLPKLLLEQNLKSTHFIPSEKPTSTKNWIAYTGAHAKGGIVLNEGAVKALMGEKVISILPVGLTQVLGHFERGDLIQIMDAQQHAIGVGKASMSADKLREVLGKKNQKPIVHYDFLHLFVY